MSSDEEVEREVRLTWSESTNGKISIITFHRPEKFNALSGAHYLRLTRLMREIDLDDETSATMIIGTGSYFSAGADVRSASGSGKNSSSSSSGTASAGPKSSRDEDIRTFFTSEFATKNLDMTRTFFHHRHPLFICLNGPVIGMSAAIVAFADFVYATPETFLLTPFASLGLAPEGGASVMFPLKMGYGLANRALLMSERLGSAELLQSGFIQKLFPREGFREAVFRHLQTVMEDKNVESMRIAKRHIRESLKERLESANVREVYDAIDRFSLGIPQEQFLRLANKQKVHKL